MGGERGRGAPQPGRPPAPRVRPGAGRTGRGEGGRSKPGQRGGVALRAAVGVWRAGPHPAATLTKECNCTATGERPPLTYER